MPSRKCFCCRQVGCKPSTCPKGDPDAQKEHADKKAEPSFLGTIVTTCRMSMSH